MYTQVRGTYKYIVLCTYVLVLGTRTKYIMEELRGSRYMYIGTYVLMYMYMYIVHST